MDSFHLVLHDQTSDKLSIYIQEDRWKLVMGDGRHDYEACIIKGLVDSAILSANQVILRLLCDMSEFSSLISLFTDETDVMLTVDNSSMSSLIYLTAEDHILLNISPITDANISLKLSGVVQSVQINIETTQLSLVRLCVVSEWSDDFIEDMKDFTMQDMIYTEVV